MERKAERRHKQDDVSHIVTNFTDWTASLPTDR